MRFVLRPRRLTCCVALLGLASACEDAVVVGPPPPTLPSRTARSSADAGVSDGATALPPFRDTDFVEADVTNRDPFRDYSVMFRTTNAPVTQRRVIMRDVSLEEMSLIAIVTGVATPYAMLVDRERVGHVVTRGDYLGRDEVVQTGGADGMPVTLNWRVDRIRDNELILTREDPTAPNRPPLTRVMTLRPPSEDDTSRGGISQVGRPASLTRTSTSDGAGAVSPAVPRPPIAPSPTSSAPR